MEDRELLEYAAKAAGINTDHHGIFTTELGVTILSKDGYFDRHWNPLINDGDARELAVKLRIDIGFYLDNPVEGSSVDASPSSSINHIYCRENTALNPDLYAGTRRAITRAAAEIGKQITD